MLSGPYGQMDSNSQTFIQYINYHIYILFREKSKGKYSASQFSTLLHERFDVYIAAPIFLKLFSIQIQSIMDRNCQNMFSCLRHQLHVLCSIFFLTISICFAFQKAKKILSIDLKIQFALIYVRKLSTKNLYTSISKYKIARYIKERLFYNIQHRFSHHIQMSILLVQSNFDYSICFENRHLYMTFIYINSFKISMQISLQCTLFCTFSITSSETYPEAAPHL